MPLATARRLISVGFALVLLGGLGLLLTVLYVDGPTQMGLDALGRFGGMTVLAVGLLLVWIGWRTLRAAARGEFARWVVPVGEWQRFIEACRLRETMPGTFPGAVPIDQEVPAQGMTVVAVRRGFRIGEGFYELGTLGAEVLDMRRVGAPVHLFEFNVAYSVNRYQTLRQAVRVPISSDATALADRVEDYWAADQPLLSMSDDALRSRRNRAFALSLVWLFVFLAVVVAMTLNNPPGWMAIFPIVTLGLGFFFFFRGVRVRSIEFRRRQ